MYVTFEDISDQARIWIYQADRKLSLSETSQIEEAGQHFLNTWGAHGHDLRASISVELDHFVIIAVDNEVQLPTGCSIDQSVQFITTLGSKLGVDFFNRTRVSVWRDNSVLLKDLKEVKQEIKEGLLTRDTLVFNNLVSTKSDMKQWKIPAEHSWLGRFFPQKVH